MPRFVAVDVSFGRFVGFGVPGLKTAGNSLKRGLKWYPLGLSGQKLAPRAYSLPVRRGGEWPVLRLCGYGYGGLSTGKGGPMAAIFLPKIKKTTAAPTRTATCTAPSTFSASFLLLSPCGLWVWEVVSFQKRSGRCIL